MFILSVLEPVLGTNRMGSSSSSYTTGRRARERLGSATGDVSPASPERDSDSAAGAAVLEGKGGAAVLVAVEEREEAKRCVCLGRGVACMASARDARRCEVLLLRQVALSRSMHLHASVGPLCARSCVQSPRLSAASAQWCGVTSLNHELHRLLRLGHAIDLCEAVWDPRDCLHVFALRGTVWLLMQPPATHA